MEKFKYKFESVLNIKETLEKKAQKEVALIDAEVERLDKKIFDIKEEFSRSRLSRRKNMKIAELKLEEQYLYLLTQQIRKLHEQIKILEKKREEKVIELIKKSKEHKMFNALKDVHRENFQIEMNKIENKIMDEIGSQRFIRNKN
jgi:flagellar protein FliJ